MDVDADIADLSVWLGKVPGYDQSPVEPSHIIKSKGIGRQRATGTLSPDNAHRRLTLPAKRKAIVLSDPTSVSTRSRSTSSAPLSNTPNPDTRQRPHVRIDVPILDPKVKQQYDYLPGHFSVERVLSESRLGKYTILLASGEIEIASEQDVEVLDNGEEALEAFQKRMNPTDRARRSRSRVQPGASGEVSLATSDADSTDRAVTGKRTRQQRDHGDDSASGDSEADTGDNDVDSINDSNLAGRRSSRLAGRRKRVAYHNDLAKLTDSDEEMPRGNRRRQRVAGQRTSRQQSMVDNFATRRSERTRAKPHRSMRERNEDEISSHSENEVGPKIVTTKEIFRKLPIEDPFRLRHRQDCEVCSQVGYVNGKGQLVYCQGCTDSYHKTCLGPRGSREHLVTKVAQDNFVLQCRRCIGVAHTKDSVAPHQGQCIVCNQQGRFAKPLRARLSTRQEQLTREENSGQDPITIVDLTQIDNAANVLFRCSACTRAWHMHHLPDRSIAQSLTDEDNEEHFPEQDLAQKRFDLYHRSWRCKDCVENQRALDALVAWRPLDQDAYIPGMTVDLVEESQKEYLIKWRSQSYLRATWMPGSWVWGVAAAAMKSAFMKKPENALPKMTTKDAMPEEFFRIDIVFDVRYNSVVRNSSKAIDLARIKEVESALVKYKGLGYEDAIWEVPPVYTETERFDDFRSAYEDYVTKVYMYSPSQSTLRRRMIEVRNHEFAHWSKKEQPTNLTGGSLMQYQLEGMNWLYYQWFRNQNAILADEMGLGKTIQLIAFFATLIEEHKCWPFLIVVPNSTCPNWRREIKKWAPAVRAVTYYGSERARKLTHDFELFPKDKDKDSRVESSPKKKARAEIKEIKAHVVIASYESIVEERTRKSLLRVPWQGLIVDEGQRLKNDKNLIYDSLSKFRFPFKVLLTGTPLQNNARELFNLIQFLDKTHNAAELEAKYSDLTPDKVPELHELLRPFFLRRTKVQVLTFLPPMAQIIVPVTMSTVQKKVYKSILAKNPQLMKSIFSREGIAQKDKTNLNNMLMQLRKTLCHPFVYSREIEERTADNQIAHRNLAEASGKLRLLHIMLPKLHERGHRVLLFSQFLDNLDIVEDFLDGLGLLHRRLDGSVNALEKQKRIDEFNAPGSPYFAFLLSTRAGGVGINLATADTVIILDPDFNPHQDIQALSRAHRIGQKNKVLVFQLMTRNSAEEKIMQFGKKKMALDHVLIERMANDDDAGENLESILRFGAQALFEDDSEDQDIVYDSSSVDKLLDRSKMESTRTSDDQSAESQFSYARIWANSSSTLEDGLQVQDDTGSDTPDAGIWDKILAERERAYQEELARKEQTYGRGKRRREKIDYHDHGFRNLKEKGTGSESSDDEEEFEREGMPAVSAEADVDFEAGDGTELSSSSEEEGSQSEQAPKMKARPFRRAVVPLGAAPHFDGRGVSYQVPVGGMPPNHVCGACSETHAMGWCRLKLAGVEHCGLCGLAHVGHGRTCPTLNDEKQVELLLATLKDSTEPRNLVEGATRYLRLIRSDLIMRRREKENQETQAAAHKMRLAASGIRTWQPPSAPLQPHRKGV